VGLTATAGQICLTKAFTGGRAAVVSVIGLSQVLFGALLEGIWTGRWLNPLGWTGLALVTFSTGWVLLRQGYFQRQSAAKPKLASPGQN
jgi:drug/metabolite transporter (DMT)-like permease